MFGGITSGMAGMAGGVRIAQLVQDQARDKRAADHDHGTTSNKTSGIPVAPIPGGRYGDQVTMAASGTAGGLTAAEDRQTTNQAMGGNNFITQRQQQMGQDIYGGQSLDTPMYKMDPNYNGEPGVQQEDFEQF